jgi:hypothetical protein
VAPRVAAAVLVVASAFHAKNPAPMTAAVTAMVKASLRIPVLLQIANASSVTVERQEKAYRNSRFGGTWCSVENSQR